MRSLTLKLMVAFLLTSLVGMALAAFFIRASVARGFDDYVFEQRRAIFASEVGAYYAANGSWEGIDLWLRAQAAYQRATAVASGDPHPVGPPRPGGGPLARFSFPLVDAAGVVVLPAERYRMGERLAPSEVARGTPVVIDGQTVGTVLAPDAPPGRNPAEEQYLANTDSALVIAGVASISIALALGALLAHLITRPVRELTAAAERIATGDLEQRVPVRSRDEIGLLTAQFNRMSADLSRAIALRRQMTADIAHDLRTPLTVISGYLEALRDRVLKPTPERFATLHAETQLLLRLVEDLHMLSLADAGELPLLRQPIAPRQLLDRVADTYRHVADQQGVTLAVEAEATVPEIGGDPEHLARVLGNLVSNALRHTPAGGQITLHARPAPAGVQLLVADTGSGIDPEHLPSVFERFYRADTARSSENGGSGLGLAIVRSLVEAHGGEVDVASTPGRGTTFTVTLPRE